MQVVILAGGLGTRLGEYTKKIPKPMVKINGVPILQRIINFYYDKSHRFIIACGYKKEIIFQYFKKLIKKNDSIVVKNNNLHIFYKRKKLKISLIDTGLNIINWSV